MRSIAIIAVLILVFSTPAACAVGVSGPASEDCGIGYTAEGIFGEKTENGETADTAGGYRTSEERNSDAGQGYSREFSISYSCSRSWAPMDLTVTVDDPLPRTIYLLRLKDWLNDTLIYEGVIEGSQTVEIKNFGVVDVRVTAFFPDGYIDHVGIYGICIDGGVRNTFNWKCMVDDWWSSWGIINNRSLCYEMGIPFSNYLKAKEYTGSRYFSGVLDYVQYTDPNVTSLADWMKKVMSGRSDLELINCALKFVQSIEYTTDEDQYGEDEYYAFPVETLWSQKGDCEDHAILFASIVKAMGFDVVLFRLETSEGIGHLAAGVNVNGASGTSFEFDGKTFYYCEATAVVGNDYFNSWNVGRMNTGRYTVVETVLVP